MKNITEKIQLNNPIDNPKSKSKLLILPRLTAPDLPVYHKVPIQSNQRQPTARIPHLEES